MANSVEVAKRLSFSDVSLHTKDAINTANVLKAMGNPSEQNFRSALKELNQSTERFARMKEVAVGQSATCNESEARRIKQELNALKFNTLEVDVKCRFMQAIKSGKPLPDHGDDPQAKEDLNSRTERVKRKKAENDGVRKEVQDLAERVHVGTEHFAAMEAAIAADLDEVLELETCEMDLSGAAGSATSGRAQEAELNAEILSLTAAGGVLDAQLESAKALLDALDKETQHLQSDLHTWKNQVVTREGFDARKAGAAVVQEHAQESARKSEIRSLIETLGGAKVQRFEAEVVRVALTTVVPPVVGAPAAAQAFRTVHHEVAMVLSPECTDKDVLNLEVVRVEVVPEVPLADLSLRRGPGEEGALSGMARVLREVRARVVAHSHRVSILEAASQLYPTAWNPQDVQVEVQLPEGVTVHLEAPLEWPRSGTHVSLQGLQGEEDGVGEDVCQRVLDKVAPKERQLATGGLVPLLQAIQVGIQEETHMQEGA